MKTTLIIKMALGSVGINVSIQTADLIDQTIIKAKKLGDQFSLMDAAKIEAGIDKKYSKEDKK